MLPGLDVFEICHRVRSDTETTKLPVLILSAKGQDSDRETAMKVGANDFLSKPVDRVALLSRIKELLAEQENPQAAG